MRYRKLIIFFAMILAHNQLWAQEDEFAYTSSFTYGINFNTNGGLIGGVGLKYTMLANGGKSYHAFGLEIVNVKNPKETRQNGWQSNFTYIPNKTHYLFAVRPNYGREFVLFRKAPEDGVHVNAIIAGGPTLGVLKPYYILYTSNNNPNDPNNVESVPFDPKIHTSVSRIQGSGYVTDGFDKLNFVLGAHIKAAVSFELGKFNNAAVGFETGVLGEAYPQTIELLYGAPDRKMFSSVFLTLFYGNKY